MKKLVAFAAMIAAVGFTSCGNKPAENVAENNDVVVEEVVIAEVPEEITEEEIAVADSTAIAEVAPVE